jgi:hypothetical protein
MFMLLAKLILSALCQLAFAANVFQKGSLNEKREPGTNPAQTFLGSQQNSC